MKKNKRQRIKGGAIIKINLSENKMVFGLLFPNADVGIYDFIVDCANGLPSINEIINKNIFLNIGLYNDVITKGDFEIIGYKELIKEDIEKVPPKFMQNLVNIHDCYIFWNDGSEKKVTPEECIGLERSAVWEAKAVVERIEDHYAGRNNFHVEHQKPILSEKDPRYLAPETLRWDFEKGQFYRTDWQ